MLSATRDLTLEGDIAFSRDTTFNAFGNTTVIATGANITSANNITINSNVLQQDGTLTANLVIFNPAAVGNDCEHDW